MTITNQNNVIIYQGNGAATVFPFSFEVPESSNMFVRLLDAVTNAVLETLAPGTYSVVGFGNPFGGSVTYPLVGSPLASDKKIMIERILPYTQDMDIQNEGGFYPEVIEDQMDRIVMQIQQIAERQARSLITNPGVPGPTFPSPEDNTVIGWDGTTLVNINPSEFISLDPTILLAAIELILPTLPTSPPVDTWKLWNNGGTLSFTTP